MRTDCTDSVSGSHRSGSPTLASQQARDAGYTAASMLSRLTTHNVPAKSRDSGCREEVALLQSKVNSVTQLPNSLAEENRVLAEHIRGFISSMERGDAELAAVLATLDASPKAESSPTRVEELVAQPRVQSQTLGYWKRRLQALTPHRNNSLSASP